jgi:hypothetical protein
MTVLPLLAACALAVTSATSSRIGQSHGWSFVLKARLLQKIIYFAF